MIFFDDDLLIGSEGTNLPDLFVQMKENPSFT